MIGNKPRSLQYGLSLIELMTALVLGLILTGGAIQIFISSKATYKTESALSRIQETGRFIVDYMSREIRMAGYTGCSSRGNITPNIIANNPPPIALNNDNALLGYDTTAVDTWSPAIPASILTGLQGINGDGVVDGDVINIMRADECGASVVGNWDVTNANVQVAFPNTCGFEQHRPVIISDCVNTDIFQIVNNPNVSGNKQTLTHSNSGNTGNFLAQNYGPDSQVSVPRSNSFYIAPGASGEPALYMASWHTNDDDDTVDLDDFDIMELADGVEDLQILYGEDTGGGDLYADSYVAASAVTDWTAVRSVRFILLLRSEDRVTAEPRAITFNGAVVNSGAGADRRLRMVYTSTVSVRNRLP